MLTCDVQKFSFQSADTAGNSETVEFPGTFLVLALDKFYFDSWAE